MKRTINQEVALLKVKRELREINSRGVWYEDEYSDAFWTLLDFVTEIGYPEVEKAHMED